MDNDCETTTDVLDTALEECHKDLFEALAYENKKLAEAEESKVVDSSESSSTSYPSTSSYATT